MAVLCILIYVWTFDIPKGPFSLQYCPKSNKLNSFYCNLIIKNVTVRTMFNALQTNSEMFENMVYKKIKYLKIMPKNYVMHYYILKVVFF